MHACHGGVGVWSSSFPARVRPEVSMPPRDSSGTPTRRRPGRPGASDITPKRRRSRVTVEATTVPQQRRLARAEEELWKNTDGQHGTPFYCSGRPRPLFRGRLHLYAFAAAPIWTALQLRLCHTSEEVAAVLVSCFGAASMLGSSGCYHCLDWKTEEAERFMGLTDLACIYMQIAFSMAPVYVLLLPASLGWYIVAVCAACAIAGGLLTFHPSGPPGRKTGTVLYCILGAAQIVPFKAFGLWSQLLLSEQRSLILCLAAYGIGSQVYANATPKLWPRTFGFHELWHLLVLIGSASTHVVNSSALRRLHP